MQMPERTYSSDKYRYGFNGKEKDKDISSLTAYDYGFRIYNPALGRFLSVDPLFQTYSYYTPYQFGSNNPIISIDVDGLESSNDKNPVQISYEVKKGDTYSSISKNSGKIISVQDLMDLNPNVNPEKLKPGQLLNLGTINLSQGQLDLLGFDLSNWHLEDPFEKKPELDKGSVNEALSKDQAEAIATGRKWMIQSIEILKKDEGVGEAGTGESLIPVWGPSRNSLNDFQNGRYVKGTGNLILAISDIFLVKDIYTGVAKGGLEAFKLGNKPWNSYRRFYLESGFAKPGEPLHHWLLEQNGSIGKHIPDMIKNQMWNLKGFANQAEHMTLAHGQTYLGRPGANFLQQLWFGTPTWPKLFTLSYGGRGAIQIGLGNE